jgi:hypothetical protein
METVGRAAKRPTAAVNVVERRHGNLFSVSMRIYKDSADGPTAERGNNGFKYVTPQNGETLSISMIIVFCLGKCYILNGNDFGVKCAGGFMPV